ncbi:MAG: hypothetical protein GY796_00560 [Chloroflexi bacterium]|nr:hypothetical protein [Chloroflexota bacterium]
MNILDENIPRNQRELLKSWRVSIRQIGYDISRKGIQDDEIIPFLHQLRRPTFFTRDSDFFNHKLCHQRYCLVYMDVDKYEAAIFVRRALRHPELDTQAKRMGAVIRVSHRGLSLYRMHTGELAFFNWPK